MRAEKTADVRSRDLLCVEQLTGRIGHPIGLDAPAHQRRAPGGQEVGPGDAEGNQHHAKPHLVRNPKRFYPCLSLAGCVTGSLGGFSRASGPTGPAAAPPHPSSPRRTIAVVGSGRGGGPGSASPVGPGTVPASAHPSPPAEQSHQPGDVSVFLWFKP